MRILKLRTITPWMMALALGFLLCGQAFAGPPVVDAYSRFRDGPVFLSALGYHWPDPPGTVLDVVNLDVTPGLYVIFAKGYATAHGGGGTKLDCNLIAGGDSDHIRVGVDGRDNFRTDEEGFSLNVLHYFTAAGTIVLRCSCDADDADLHALKVTAVRVNSYWNVPQ